MTTVMLDPTPWYCKGHDCKPGRDAQQFHYEDIFSPRDGYSQLRSDYEG